MRVATILAASCAMLAAPAALAAVGPKPPIDDKVATARWIVANTRWAFIATIAHDRPGSPFNNVISTANITMPSTGHQGVPVFYTSAMDASSKDIAVNNNVSLGLSEAQLGLCGEDGSDDVPDPESPLCARLVLSGRFMNVSSTDRDAAVTQLFTEHPEMKSWPTGHDWLVSYLQLDQIWLIDTFGGASIVPPEVYWAWKPSH